MRKILCDYCFMSSPWEIAKDFLPSLLISAVSFLLMLYVKIPYNSIRQTIITATEIILTTSSILSGFSLAAVTMIATSDNEVVNKLKKTYIENKSKTLFHFVVNSFVYCFIIHIVIVTLAGAQILISNLNLSQLSIFQSFLPIPESLMYFVMAIDIFATLYALSLTVKNVIILNAHIEALAEADTK